MLRIIFPLSDYNSRIKISWMNSTATTRETDNSDFKKQAEKSENESAEYYSTVPLRFTDTRNAQQIKTSFVSSLYRYPTKIFV